MIRLPNEERREREREREREKRRAFHSHGFFLSFVCFHSFVVHITSHGRKGKPTPQKLPPLSLRISRPTATTVTFPLPSRILQHHPIANFRVDITPGAI
jgi:hypothetical protein